MWIKQNKGNADTQKLFLLTTCFVFHWFFFLSFNFLLIILLIHWRDNLDTIKQYETLSRFNFNQIAIGGSYELKWKLKVIASSMFRVTNQLNRSLFLCLFLVQFHSIFTQQIILSIENNFTFTMHEKKMKQKWNCLQWKLRETNWTKKK